LLENISTGFKGEREGVKTYIDSLTKRGKTLSLHLRVGDCESSMDSTIYLTTTVEILAEDGIRGCLASDCRDKSRAKSVVDKSEGRWIEVAGVDEWYEVDQMV